MPPRVTYWTGIWEPRREAVSKQVEAIRSALAPRAKVVSFSGGQRTRLTVRDGVVRLSGRRWLTLRALAALVEPRGEISHLVAGLGSWHLVRALGRRPLLFTVAIPGQLPDLALLEKVALFVAETEDLAARLLESGVASERVRLVRPGVDLDRYRPEPAPPGAPFRLLFASSPADPTAIESRGIPLLIELGRAVPDIEIVLLWRRWGDLARARRVLESLAPPANVKVVERDVEDMRTIYRSVHATACFFDSGYGKSCPTFVIEGLATGRPALTTDTVAVSDLLERRGAGVVSSRTIAGITDALQRLRLDYPRISRNARRLAESDFDRNRTISTYRGIYAELVERSGRRAD